MKIVIDIPDEMYLNAKTDTLCGADILVSAIKNGKPLPKGHWIEERTYMECPNCHDIWHYEENQTERFKFCPNCGAKMEGAEE